MGAEAQGHRIRVEATERHVKISLNGLVFADTKSPVLLHETGLPTRYYVPSTDVRMELLTPTEKHSDCPFKGTASYWTVKVGEETIPNLVWSYPEPIAGAEGIAGLLCFYNERVDVEVDGDLQPRPDSPWS